MTIQIHRGAITVPVQQINFSDKGSNFRIDWPEGLPVNGACIAVMPSTPVDSVLQEIATVVNFLNNVPDNNICRYNLALSYLPHGRADRVFETTNPLPQEAFFDALTAFPIDHIFLTDPHSDAVWPKYKNHFQFSITTQMQCFLQARVPLTQESVLVAPDEGAVTKLSDLAAYLKVPFILASKERDLDTGRVIRTCIPDGISYAGRHFVIVDDIADGGGTFIPLAEKLKEAGARQVDLFVTHGIFAKGLEPFEGVIDNVYVFQIVGEYITRDMLMAFNSKAFQ